MATASGWFRYSVERSLTDREAAALVALAGPVYQPWKNMIHAHVSGAWLVERYLIEHSIPARCVARADVPQPLAALPALSELREWVPSFLRGFQREFILWAATREGVLGVLPTGAGKSLCGLTYGLLRPGLTVFVTRAGARRTIVEEIEKYTTCRWHLVQGDKPKPIPEGTRVVVVGWERLAQHIHTILAAQPVTAIFDESHLAANHKRREAVIPLDTEGKAIRREDGEQKIDFVPLQNRFYASELLSRAVKWRMALTATPVRDRIRNLWAQIDLILPRAVGPFYAFARRYCDAHENPWGGIDTRGKGSPEVLKELADRMSFFTFHVAQSVTHRDLPPKRRQVTYVKASELSTGKDVLRELRQHQGDDAWTKLAHAAAMKRKRVVDAAVYGAVPSCDGVGGGKVVVLTGLRSDAEKIAAALNRAFDPPKAKGSAAPPRTPVWVGHGGHSQNQRDSMRHAYMEHPGPCVLVGTTDSWGESLNLHDTDLAIISMLPITPGQVRQVEGRFKRLGMKRPVLVMYLIAEGTADEHVAQMLLGKLPAVEAIVGDEELISFEQDLRGNEDEIANGLLAKILTASEDEEPEPALEAT